MEKKTLGQLALLWLKARVKIIGLYLVVIASYWLVVILSKIYLEPILYSTQLVLFIGIVVSIADYRSYVRKHYRLLDLYENTMVTLEHLPEPKDLLEEDYQYIIRALATSRQIMKQQVKKQESEMVDYYTLWAHQIKTPITAMRLLLQGDDLETQVYELGQELFKIEQYVEMVLQYLRLESISSDMVLRSYNLCDIVRSALKKYAMSFIGRKITLDFEPFEEWVITDEKWITFVIEQLLSNSLKYTHSGKITIRMENRGIKTLVIEDTGIGISPEDLPRIFDRGFTGYNGRMDKKSTGIGLYLCKQVTTKLSHTLEVTSKVKEGTKVSIGFREDKQERMEPYKNESIPGEM